MNIVFIGDCDYNTGPSNVNKSFRRYLSEQIYFLKYKQKIVRAAEAAVSVLKAEAVIISGLSIINGLALNEAAILKKPVIYIMHGCYAYECEINRFNKDNKALQLEKKMLEKASIIVTVSEKYMNLVAAHFPEYKNKLTYINNGIEWSDFVNVCNHTDSCDPYMILSMGGGRPQKNNIVVCDAVQILNEKYHKPFQYIVLGRDYQDTPKIKQKKYTNYVGQVSRKEVLEWLEKTSIYIQNSSYESFGLAPIEALCMGCNLLISQNVGAISILNTITESDMILDCMNAEEIAQKIMQVYNNNNQNRLLSGIDRDTSSCEFASRKLMEIITNYKYMRRK